MPKPNTAFVRDQDTVMTTFQLGVIIGVTVFVLQIYDKI